MKKSKIAVIIYGAPGSGKGTQAQLLAEKLDLVHFDTGRYIRETIYDPAFAKNKIIERERRLNEAGKLCTPSWVFGLVKKKINELHKLNKGVVLGGSPRTLPEAFEIGNGGLIKILEKDYGKKNIYVFQINISAAETIKRNTHRLVCSICGTPILGKFINVAKYKNIGICPFCGGKLKHRFDDSKKIIIERLKEYAQRTLPIVKELEKRRYKVFKINGSAMPYKIHQRILAKIR